MNYFDIGIIAIIVLAMFIGFAKGFSKSIASLFSWVISIAVAALLAKTVANALLGVPVVSQYFFSNPGGFSVADWINGILPENLQISMYDVRRWIIIDGQVIEGAPDVLLNNIKDENAVLGIFLGLFKGSYLESLASEEMLSYNVDTLGQGLSILLANSLLILASGLVIMIVLKVVTNIIYSIAKKAAGPGKSVSFASRFVGMIIGTVKGALICAAVFVFLSFLINFPFLEPARAKLLDEESYFAGKSAIMVFEWTDKLLETSDLARVMEFSGYEKNIDLSNLVPPSDDDGAGGEVFSQIFAPAWA